MVCVAGGISTPRQDSLNETTSKTLMEDVAKILEWKWTPTKFEPKKWKTASYRVNRIPRWATNVTRWMTFLGTRDTNWIYLHLLSNLIDPKSKKDTLLITPDNTVQGRMHIYIVPSDMKWKEEVVQWTSQKVRWTLVA